MCNMAEDFKRRFIVSLILTIPILLLSFSAGTLMPETLVSDFYGSEYILLFLSSAIFIYGGYPFFKGFITEVMESKPGMMTLIALAITVAYIYSVLTTFGLEGKTFFWELATLIDIMLLGHYIEMKTVMGASDALKKLAALLPNIAHKVMPDGNFQDIKLSDLKSGDQVLIKPGEKVSADGIITSGQSEVNEAALTGESKPVTKSEGMKILGGAINGSGALTIKIEATGDSYISQVVALVKGAMESKSKAQDLANRAAFVLTIIAISVGTITFISWMLMGQGIAFSMERTVTVMIITCPHALGLATPLVISAITGIAALNGLVIRNRVAFESAKDLNIIVFDKTGTLTTGEFGITEVKATGDQSRGDQSRGDQSRGDQWNENEILSKAAAVEQKAKHSIANSIVEHAKSNNINIPEITNASVIPGKGARGDIGGETIFVGNFGLLESLNLKVPESESEDKTIVFVATKDKVRGLIVLSDSVRSESKETCKSLKDLGYKVAMITGDNKSAADVIAKELGIDVVLANVLPDKKAEEIKKLQGEGNKVAMVGDGINDAPALAQADVGIAIGAGTDIAIETADIILVKNDTRNVVDIIKLSRLTRKKMVQNLVWATGYNVIAIPLAAGVIPGLVLSPAIGAVVMSLSTVVVAINSKLIKY